MCINANGRVKANFPNRWFFSLSVRVYLEEEETSQDCKTLPEYISTIVKVSSCPYQKTVLGFFRIWNVRIWVFEFCHNFRFWVLSQFKFFCIVIAIWVLLLFELSQYEFWVLSQYEFWVLSQFKFLRYVTTWVEFCRHLSF